MCASKQMYLAVTGWDIGLNYLWKLEKLTVTIKVKKVSHSLWLQLMCQLAWYRCTISNQWDTAINCLDRMLIIFIPQTKSHPMRLFLDELSLSFDIALSEKNSLSRTPTRMQMPFFSPISILLWIWPQKVSQLFCKSQPAAQRCSFL